MKKLNIIVKIIMFSIIIISCKKKEIEEVVPEPVLNFKATTTSGQTWSSSSLGATYQYGVIVIKAKASDGSSILLRFKPFENYETELPYEFGYLSSSNVATYMTNDTAATSYLTNLYEANYGVINSTSENKYYSQVKLTSFNKTDKKISGKFYFTALNSLTNDSISFKNGTFNNIVYSDVLPPTPDNLLTLKIDNISWTAPSVMATFSSYLGISVTGTNSSKTIGIYVPSEAEPGTFTPSQWGNYRVVYNSNVSSSDPNLIFYGYSGQLIITENNKDAKYIKGTFSVQAKNGYNSEATLSNGEFVGNY